VDGNQVRRIHMPYDREADNEGGRRLKVALFSGNYNYTADGANRALNRLVGHLERTDCARVRVYSPTSSTPAFAPQGELVSAPSFAVPLRPDYRLAMGLTPRLVRDVERFAPDVIHLSAPDPLGFAAQSLARRRGIPVVASVHTHFEAYLPYYGLDWLRPLVEARLRAFYLNCDYVLAPTPALAARLAEQGLGDRARVWSRGVDRLLFNPANHSLDWRRAQGIGDGDVALVFFGRMVMEKGLGVFAEAVEHVLRQRPDVKVLAIGDGPARAWLEARLPAAIFTGFLTGRDLARAVASGDVLINPSSTETFCNVTLEAMASGLAVVCADAPNHRNLIRSPAVGLLRPAEAAADFAEAALMLVADPAARLAMGGAARAESANYDWDEILSGVAATYRECHARSSGARVAGAA
jgi:phosphatidylinositol alpha 1,6-mannosyltransferase